jgi:hypothetical protein
MSAGLLSCISKDIVYKLVRQGTLFPLECLVVLLEAGHDAEIGLTVGTVVLGLAPQDATVGVRRIPAKVAS